MMSEANYINVLKACMKVQNVGLGVVLSCQTLLIVLLELSKMFVDQYYSLFLLMNWPWKYLTVVNMVPLFLVSFDLFILLLPDDVVLLSETVTGLQIQLHNLQYAANALKLKVNMNKSNMMVFRKGGHLGVRERWTYDCVMMPVVNVYIYLGILSTRLSVVTYCRDLASCAKNALLCIMKKLPSFKNISLKLFINIFESYLQSMCSMVQNNGD